MNTQKLREILNHPLDSGVSIVTSYNDNTHIANTWLSYVRLVGDSALYIPVAGMMNTENNLKKNPKVLISISNRELQGKMMQGTGVIVSGTGEILSEGEMFNKMKSEFEWIRAILKIDITDVIQTL
ncbi:MAG: pyridoxamine 5'-phosphate oxidase family protein [Clostridium sp.]|uniref:pyridoxamine 5'-phosphate oxidase family protein n=1 Tax=Clostridium sp. TaxID=1506 RepID=UPI002FC97159